MNKKISPMLASLTDEIPRGDWVYEMKWDGYRALSFCHKKKVDLISRNHKSFNEKFYSLHKALQELNIEAVLDGEIVVLQETGAASFEHLQNWRSEADGELVYYVFDLLSWKGKDVMHLPLMQRKELLNQILPSSAVVRINESFVTDPKKFLSVAKKLGSEGIIAKRKDSLYHPGERGLDWLKIKVKNRREVVIGGYTINENSPKLFSALLVGVYEKGAFHYCGKVGTGFSDSFQKEMLKKFQPLTIKKCPFSFIPDVNKPSRFRPNPPHASCVWLSPQLVCEVNYTEITREGVFRHPSFVALREDKNAKDVHPERAIKLKEVIKGDRKTLLNPTEETQSKIIQGHELKFNHLSKIFFPNENVTKRDLINYYYQIAPYILPYLKNRPQSLNRFPNGIQGISFYQKDVTKSAPEWMMKFPYHTSDDKDKNYLVVQGEADLLWMANLGAIEMNPWNSTIEAEDYPNWCLIDIDPTEKNNFDQVIQTALVTRQVLLEWKIESYCKTSGATGLHVYIPMGAQYTYEQCQLFGRMIATAVHERLPKFTSIERYKEKRKGKIYVDFLQNRPKATLAAPYSVRPQPFATVSMPLHWDEVKKGLLPRQFNIKNAVERIKREGDLFKPVIGKGIPLEKVFKGFFA